MKNNWCQTGTKTIGNIVKQRNIFHDAPARFSPPRAPAKDSDIVPNFKKRDANLLRFRD
jgi:hypothetical protein